MSPWNVHREDPVKIASNPERKFSRSVLSDGERILFEAALDAEEGKGKEERGVDERRQESGAERRSLFRSG